MNGEAPSFEDVVRIYDMPARDLRQAPSPSALSAVTTGVVGRLRLARRRRTAGRRLAYLDSTFPWERSGFRYHEALALLELRPDTLFFSLWEMTDPFPAEVHPLAEFGSIAFSHGITDAYGVFQLFLEGLVGMRSGEPVHPMQGPDITPVLTGLGISLHGTIHASGGFTNTPYGIARARELSARLQTAFSSILEVQSSVPGVTPVDAAYTDTRFYTWSERRWRDRDRVVCLFASDKPPRKGIDAVISAFRELSPARFHLHVVGPHEDRSEELPPELATFHGWLHPTRLRELHDRAHIFVSPVSAEAPGPDGSFSGVIDGFPTQAAVDAMSSGVLLVSANPEHDHRVFEAGRHYVECGNDADRLRLMLLELAGDPERMREVAVTGSERVRERMDVRRGAARKLELMGLGEPVGDRAEGMDAA